MTRSRPITILAGTALAPLTALALSACGGSGGAAAAPPAAAAPSPASAARHAPAVGVANNSKLGKILVDSRGRTLYLFKKDSGTKSACFGACATAWPPLRTSGKPAAGSGAKASLLGTIKRSDGKAQVTYHGHPLYTFVMDTKAGDVTGEGVNAFGGLWFAVSPAGKQLSGKRSSSGSGSSSSGAAAPAAPKPAAPKPAPAPKKSPPKSNGIPQNNGGDQDADNNGGPSDGDGNL